ncbi:hypothetical protein [Crateriforma spongiae]|uniref:hypothetical protein n=1 Tax=Crateriforma spongiae TaxID=2724528 RepID=UPI0039AF37E3
MTKFRIAKTAAALATVALTSTVSAQGLGNALSGLQSQTQQQIQQRVQGQVQQRVQAQVQQQLQTKVQAQVQSNIQGRVQAQVQNQIQQRVQNQVNTTVRQAVGLAARAQRAVDVSAGANASLSAKGSVNGNRVRANQNVGVNARVGSQTGIGIGDIAVTQQDVAAFDSIFGQFNPLRKAAIVDAAAVADAKLSGRFAAEAKRPTEPASSEPSVGADQADQSRSQVSTVASSMNQVASDQASQTGDSGQSASSESSAQGRAAVVGFLSAKADLQAEIVAAAQQRRAEISQMRDQALADANAELMMRADQIEAQLDAFTQTQIAAAGEARQRATAAVSENAVKARGRFRANASQQIDAAGQSIGGQASVRGRGSATVR